MREPPEGKTCIFLSSASALGEGRSSFPCHSRWMEFDFMFVCRMERYRDSDSKESALPVYMASGDSIPNKRRLLERVCLAAATIARRVRRISGSA